MFLIWALPKGRAFRFNLLFFKEKNKRIFTAIPNAIRINMKIQEIIYELNKYKNKGFQLEKQNGILTSTWLVYKRKNKFYYFDINQKIEFIKEYCYTEIELTIEFNHCNYNIELAIN